MTEAEKYSRPDMNNWNLQIMEEFHVNEGKERLKVSPGSCSPSPEPGVTNAARRLSGTS